MGMRTPPKHRVRLASELAVLIERPPKRDFVVQTLRGERPTTPAPEPAHPDAQAQKDGATPALPPAPAEKTAPPIKER